jgi:hypothetical protein
LAKNTPNQPRTGIQLITHSTSVSCGILHNIRLYASHQYLHICAHDQHERCPDTHSICSTMTDAQPPSALWCPSNLQQIGISTFSQFLTILAPDHVALCMHYIHRLALPKSALAAQPTQLIHGAVKHATCVQHMMFFLWCMLGMARLAGHTCNRSQTDSGKGLVNVGVPVILRQHFLHRCYAMHTFCYKSDVHMQA